MDVYSKTKKNMIKRNFHFDKFGQEEEEEEESEHLIHTKTHIKIQN